MINKIKLKYLWLYFPKLIWWSKKFIKKLVLQLSWITNFSYSTLKNLGDVYITGKMLNETRILLGIFFLFFPRNRQGAQGYPCWTTTDIFHADRLQIEIHQPSTMTKIFFCPDSYGFESVNHSDLILGEPATHICLWISSNSRVSNWDFFLELGCNEIR